MLRSQMPVSTSSRSLSKVGVNARNAGLRVLVGEAWRVDGHLLSAEHRLTPGMAERIRDGASVSDDELRAALAQRPVVLREFDEIFRRVELIALPTLPDFAPRLSDPTSVALTSYTRPANLAGTPAISIPVPVPPTQRRPETAHLPASLQLMGPPNSEEILVVAARRIESATRR